MNFKASFPVLATSLLGALLLSHAGCAHQHCLTSQEFMERALRDDGHDDWADVDPWHPICGDIAQPSEGGLSSSWGDYEAGAWGDVDATAPTPTTAFDAGSSADDAAIDAGQDDAAIALEDAGVDDAGVTDGADASTDPLDGADASADDPDGATVGNDQDAATSPSCRRGARSWRCRGDAGPRRR